MKLSKSIKLLVGAGTIWVLIYPLLFMVILFSSMESMFSSSLQPPFLIFSIFDLILPAHCFTILVELTLLGFYLFHIIKNIAASEVIRVIFGVVIFFMPFIGMPVYYYLFIWRDVPPPWALPQEHKPAQIQEGNSELNPPEKAKGPSKNLVIIGGVVGAVVLIFCGAAIVFYLLIGSFTQRMRDQMLTLPTPVHYDALPAYSANEKAFYQPVEPSSFIPVNTFKGIYTWDPILLDNNNMFIAGYLHEVGNSWGSGINLDIINADVNTGKVNWQAVAGSGLLLKDAQHIYAEAPNNFGASGVVAYDIDSGIRAWETRFTNNNAAGVGNIVLTDTDLQVEAYLHGNDSVYILDKATGKVKEFVNNSPLQGVEEGIIYDGLRLEKQDLGKPGQVTATHISDGSKAWEYDGDTVISNIAVGGPTTYFLTDKNQLIAVNTNTGEVLGILRFAPRFARDFDFVNTPTLVAADGDLVAVYYDDSHQLSVFRFAEAVK